MIDQRGLAFTPQQMAGYKGYSRGVLIGNFQEDLCVYEEKMRLNAAKRSRSAPVDPATAPVQPSPAAADGTLRFGSRVQIESCQGGWLLSIFPNKPRVTLPQNHTFVSGAQPQHGVGPIGRNVWTLRPSSLTGAANSSPAAGAAPSASASSSSVLHGSTTAARGADGLKYGDTVMLVNEWGSSEGHLLLCSEHRTLLNAPSSGAGVHKKGAQEVTACLGETSLGNWTVEPAGTAAGLDTARLHGKPVRAGDPVVLRHALSGSPLGVDETARIKGMPNSKAQASDQAVECLVGCFNDKEAGSRSKSVTNPANFFQLVLSPPGTEDVLPTHLPTAEQVFEQLLDRLRQRNELFHSLRGLARTFRIVDRDRNQSLARAELKVALGHFMGPNTFTNREVDMVFAGMDRNKDGKVSTTEFYRYLRGEMNARRRQIVSEAFSVLAGPAGGVVPFEEMKRRYQRGLSRHPDVLSGKSTEDDVVRDFIATWDHNKDDRISFEEFVEYYNDLSCSVDDDDYFELMIRNAWHLTGGEGWCENTSNKRVLVMYHGGKKSEVVELENDLGLDYDDMQAVLAHLEKQGFDLNEIKKVDLKGAV